MTSTKLPSARSRAELTDKLLGIKRENGWSWKHICGEIGGMSPVLGHRRGSRADETLQAAGRPRPRTCSASSKSRAGAAQRGAAPRHRRCRRPTR